MTTFFCNSSVHRGQSYPQEKMSRVGKVKPQVKLSFPPNGPPTLDPAPTPPKSRVNRNSWPGQMWSHLTSMFTSQPTIYWVNPQMVSRDSQPPPPPPLHHQHQTMPHFAPQNHFAVPPPALNPGGIIGGGGDGALWHVAPPGNQQHQQMMDPVLMLQGGGADATLPVLKITDDFNTINTTFPGNKMATGCYFSGNWNSFNTDFTTTNTTTTTTKPLNPYAQEWIPPGYMQHHHITTTTTTTTSTPVIPSTPLELKKEAVVMNSSCPPPPFPPTNTGMNAGNETQIPDDSKIQIPSDYKAPIPCHSNFSYSLEKELKKVSDLSSSKVPESQIPAKNCNASETTQGNPDFQVSSLRSLESTEKIPESTRKVLDSTGKVAESTMNLPASTGNVPESTRKVPESTGKVPESTRKVPESTGKVPVAERVAESTKKSGGECASYAKVVELCTASPPPLMSSPKHHGVEQPIPKIFQRDRSPPKEVLHTETVPKKVPQIYRRPRKCRRAREFLLELKESGGVETGGGCYSSSPSSSSSSSSFDLSFSPVSPHGLSSPVASPLLNSCGPSMGKPNPETPNSPGGNPPRIRLESETSSDVEFVDEADCVPHIHSPSNPVTQVGGRKPVNRFLACILGSDSEEEEEEEEEEDWDEVCVSGSSPADLDDSWETFELQMLVIQCPEVVEQCRTEPKCSNNIPQCYTVLPPLTECQHTPEETTDSRSLAEINKKWEMEVEKDVRGSSAKRVTFGSAKEYPMVVWRHAYRQARRGTWEQQARDRERFRNRIGIAEMELSPVLEPSHRSKVYRRLYGGPPTTPCWL